MSPLQQKPIIKVIINEDSPEESTYFFERLLEKVILDQLDIHLKVKGDFLNSKFELEE